MAQASFVVNNDAAAAKTFTLQSQDLKSAGYIDMSSTLMEPVLGVISHDIKPTGSSGSDRHSVSFKIVKLDSNNVAHTISASMTLTVPRATVITDTMVQDVRAFLVNYLTNANVAKLIDGVTP